MNVSKSMLKLTGLALAVGMFVAPMTADAGRFRGAGSGSGTYMIDTDGDGIGDTRPTPGTVTGANAANFVDADGDGICDTSATGGVPLLDGSGSQTKSRGARANR